MYQIKKSRIKVKTNLIVNIDVYKIAKLKINNQCDAIIDITNNNNNKSNNNDVNIDLVEFGIYIKILLINTVNITCCR